MSTIYEYALQALIEEIKFSFDFTNSAYNLAHLVFSATQEAIKQTDFPKEDYLQFLVVVDDELKALIEREKNVSGKGR